MVLLMHIFWILYTWGIDQKYQLFLDTTINSNFTTNTIRKAHIFVSNLAASNINICFDYDKATRSNGSDSSQIAKLKAMMNFLLKVQQRSMSACEGIVDTSGEIQHGFNIYGFHNQEEDVNLLDSKGIIRIRYTIWISDVKALILSVVIFNKNLHSPTSRHLSKWLWIQPWISRQQVWTYDATTPYKPVEINKWHQYQSREHVHRP